MVVVTAVDRLFGSTGKALTQARTALDVLRERGIPIVCVSNHHADIVTALGRKLGDAAPLICHGGRQLHVPYGYFWAAPPMSAGEPSVIETAGVGNAVAIVRALFQACQPDVMTVGIGEYADGDLLAEVDVPIIVRPATVSEWALGGTDSDGLYVTHYPGVAGWSEAILGWPS